MSETFYRRNLPHWDVGGATYFVTICLAGSAPARRRRSTQRTKAEPRRDSGSRAGGTTSAGQAFADYDKRLDLEPAIRWLEDPRLAGVVADAIRWGAGSRYDLIAYVVMPSHVHWVFTPLTHQAPRRLSQRLDITASFKSYTASSCNRLLGRRGRFWQQESYDRVVRSVEELERIVRYVEHNPVRAGLCTRAEEWAFSSAASRP